MTAKNKIFALLATMLLSSATVSANAESFTLGSCDHQIASGSGYGSDSAGEIAAAMYVPASRLKTLAGNTISRIDVGLISRINVREMTVWVRKDLQGENLASGYIERGNLGWNDVTLTTPYKIEANCPGLYIGFNYANAGSSHPVSITGKAGDYTTWLKTSASEGWKDMTSAGALSIEAIVTGSNIPLYDLTFVSGGLAPDPSAGDDCYIVSGTVTNMASRTVTGFHVDVNEGGKTAGGVDIKLNVAPGETASFAASFAANTKLSGNVTLTITSLADGKDADESNNSVTASVAFTRNVLLEEFTTENCPNCPEGARMVHTVLESKPPYTDHVVAVCHHAAFGTDWMTRPCDTDLLFMFGPAGQVFAPSAMFNRLPIFRQGLLQDKEEPIVALRSEEVIKQCIDKALEIPAHAMIGLKVGEIRETSAGTEVDVEVSVLTDSQFNLSSPVIVFYTLENDVMGDYQEGAGKNYLHQHVIRTDNGPLGQALELKDGAYRNTFTVNLDPAWNRDNIYFASFVANLDESDIDNNIVENVSQVNLISKSTGINGVSAVNEIHETARYDMMGNRISGPVKGLNIIVFNDGSIKKIFNTK